MEGEGTSEAVLNKRLVKIKEFESTVLWEESVYMLL